MSADLSSIINYLQITDRITTGGQPTPGQIRLLQEAGCRVVINLALPTSLDALPNEGELVTRLGMSYVHIPVVWEQPQLDDFKQFLVVMKAFEDRPVFVHCARNMRVSCFVYLYRVIALHEPAEQGFTAIHHIWQPDDTWLRYMRSVEAHYINKGE